MLTISVNTVAKARKAKLHGRVHYVAPMVLVVEGVLNGSLGPLFYPGTELSKNPEDWNHMPIVLNHPMVEGRNVSARQPDVLDKYGVGLVLNSSWHSSELKMPAEGWFDEDKTAAVDGRILVALKKGNKVELSTGLDLIATPVPEGTVYNGKTYTHTTSGYRPDHLAVLPDDVGACSIKDGCGILVNSEGAVLALNELSHDELRYMIAQVLRSQYTQDQPHCYIAEVFDDYVVYHQGEELYKVGYRKSDDSVSLVGQPKHVTRKVSYEYAENTQEDNMALTANQKAEKVTFIVSNCDCWKGDDGKKLLESFTDDRIEGIANGVQRSLDLDKEKKYTEKLTAAARKGFAGTDGTNYTYNEATGQFEPVKKPVEPVVNNTTPAPTLSDEQREDLEWARRHKTQEKAKLLHRLTANIKDEVARRAKIEKLSTRKISELEELIELLPTDDQRTEDNVVELAMNYSGAPGGSRTTDNRHVEENLEPFEMDWK